MRGSRSTDEQIVGVLREADAGASTGDLCRRHGISPAAFYNWKARLGGMGVPVGTCRLEIVTNGVAGTQGEAVRGLF